MIKKINYGNQFIVHQKDNKYYFVHISINKEHFYKLLFNYFFKEERLLKYIENKETIKFKPERKNYVKMYKNLKIFIDEENTQFNEEKFYHELEKFIDISGKEKNSLIKFRKDKVGKIGEYIFSIILLEYFNMKCIFPKLTMITDPNMSVFGIDTLFYDEKKKMLLFGESKFYSKLKDGVSALKQSLKTYEKQIEDEYILVLSHANNYHMPVITDNYIDSIDECYTFKEFIEKEKITNIGIPLFVMHGGDINFEEVISEYNKIESKSFFGLNTVYYCMSLPILSSDDFKAEFLEYVHERIKEYERYK